MTEAEWLVCEDPTEMLHNLPSPTERKQRLFGVACCRQNWDLLTDTRLQNVVVVAERLADDPVTEATRVETEVAAWEADDRIGDFPRHIEVVIPLVQRGYAVSSAEACARIFCESAEYYAEGSFEGLGEELRTEQAVLTRCIFGNPFWPAHILPAWLTSTVVSLANGIYSERAFDRLPILADALMDAGCDHADVLDHCRSEGPHVRGCWVIDLLLGKC